MHSRPKHSFALVRILHYSDVVEVARSVKGHSIIDTSVLSVRRLIFATLCALAALLLPSLAQADTRHTGDVIVRFVVTDIDRDGDPDLVATTGHARLHVWINHGRGLFAAASGRFHSGHTRLVHHPKPGVRGVQPVRLDDSTLNDSNRLLIAGSAPATAHLVLVGETPDVADAPFTNLTCRRRPPRGPPPLLVS